MTSIQAQNLMEARVQKLGTREQSIYQGPRIVHNGPQKNDALLIEIRHSFHPAKQYERLVFQFKGDKVPKIYGHIGQEVMRLNFFKTKIDENVTMKKNGKFIKGIDLIPFQNEYVSLETLFNGPIISEIFFLENPGRLVIDLKSRGQI